MKAVGRFERFPVSKHDLEWRLLPVSVDTFS